VSQPMREALMQLPGEQRRALVLAVFHGYTAREVSELDKTRSAPSRPGSGLP
jgi:DNA-directed RNA polymerase specialized sigma24 family protein